jgi:hypothetical protein
MLDIMNIQGQRGDPWPGTNIMQVLKHNKKIGSFVVKVKATSAWTKR